jgi:1-phosphatidylinositol-3-phosphate 5-kinase
VIPGGDVSECAYVDGLVFRKNLAHKHMASSLVGPRIMLLSGGIEFQRTETRITSLDTLVDQEARYMQILVRAGEIGREGLEG